MMPITRFASTRLVGETLKTLRFVMVFILYNGKYTLLLLLFYNYWSFLRCEISVSVGALMNDSCANSYRAETEVASL